jgi:hypothetical protein
MARRDSLVTVKIEHPRVHADHDTAPDVGPAAAPIATSREQRGFRGFT